MFHFGRLAIICLSRRVTGSYQAPRTQHGGFRSLRPGQVRRQADRCSMSSGSCRDLVRICNRGSRGPSAQGCRAPRDERRTQASANRRVEANGIPAPADLEPSFLFWRILVCEMRKNRHCRRSRNGGRGELKAEALIAGVGAARVPHAASCDHASTVIAVAFLQQSVAKTPQVAGGNRGPERAAATCRRERVSLHVS